MKFSSDVIGRVVTGLYLVAVCVLVFLKRDTLPSMGLNEIGDFLAGAFGPVAFLWLILGYLQQGRELKLSSEALRMQAAELKNSVEQQTQLVAVGREQITAQTKALKQDRLRYEQSMNANIVFIAGKLNLGTPTIHNYQITNVGADALDIEMLVRLPNGRSMSATIAFLKKDQFEDVPFEYVDIEEDFLTTLHFFTERTMGELWKLRRTLLYLPIPRN